LSAWFAAFAGEDAETSRKQTARCASQGHER